MSEPAHFPNAMRDDALRARHTAQWLALGRRLDLLALAAAVPAAFAAQVGMATTPLRWLLPAIVALGLAALATGLRVAFDRAIFAAWSEDWRTQTDISADLAACDAFVALLWQRAPACRRQRSNAAAATARPVAPASAPATTATTTSSGNNAPDAAALRPLAARIAGALALLRRQAQLVALQWLALLAACAAGAAQ
jgi:hypothetical protein